MLIVAPSKQEISGFARYPSSKMSNKSPIFPARELQHFTDYGFDSQFDYFQVMEEVRKHKKESSRFRTDFRFKLQKPTPKIKKNKKCWWRNALQIFKSRKWESPGGRPIGSKSNPLYMTESTSGSSPAYETGTVTKGELQIPYFNLRDLNMDHQNGDSTTAMPVYMVT